MKLISLYIENFGKLHQWSFDFSEGLNTICEDNGWGKSTLAVFIKSMFYGLPKTGKRDLDENERKKYAPWQGGNFGGYLVFECTVGKFRIERSFSEPDVFSLKDLTTGKESTAFSENIGQELFGIDADGFERSVYLSFKSLLPSGKNDTIRAKLTGVLDDVNDMGIYEKAYATVESRAKDYKKTGNRGMIPDLTRDLQNLREREQDKNSYQSQLKLVSKQHSDAQAAVGTAEQNQNALQKQLDLAKQFGQLNTWKQNLSDMEGKRAKAEQSFPNGIPAAEDIQQQRARIQKNAVLQSELQHIGLSAQEQQDLLALSGMFRAGVPDNEEIMNCYQDASALKTDRAVHHTKKESLERSRDQDSDRLRALPGEAEVKSALETAGNLRGDSSKGENRSGKVPFLPVALILFAIGIGALAAGLLIPLVYLAILGAVCVGGGLVSLILSFRNKKAKKDASSEPGEEAVRAFLSRYGAHKPGNDLLAETASLAEEIRATRVRLTETEKELAGLDEKEIDFKKTEMKLRDFLERYHVYEQDFETGLRNLSDSAKEYRRLTERKDHAESMRVEKTNELNRSLKECEAFFRKFPFCLIYPDSEQRMNTVEAEVNTYRNLAAQIESEKNRIEQYTRQTGLNEAAGRGIRDPEVLEKDLDDAKSRLKDLREAERKLNIEQLNLERETDDLPEIREAIEARKEALADAMEHHRLLTLTCEYLADARESLTARYLPKTRENFDRYLSKLSKTDAPKAEIDAELEVSVMDAGLSRKWECYSRGWRDILQFCARLALVDALFEEGEKPFLLLDDPFTNLDEKRLVSAKQLLTELTGDFQILYLVCHEDRA